MQLILKTKQLPNSSWETVLPETLHAVRSLLCTSTNATPHERFLSFPGRSMISKSLPSWLIQPGPVLLRRLVRNKNESLVDEVELMEANPNFAHIRFPDGKLLSKFPDGPQYQLLIWPRALPKQLPFRNLILIMMKLRINEQPTTTSDSSPLHIYQRHESISSHTIDNSLPTVTTSPDHSTRSNSSDSLLSQPLVLRRSSRNTSRPNKFGNNVYDISQ